jgi:hypothetical protein
MRFLDLTLADPASNLALDEALLLDAETPARDRDILRPLPLGYFAVGLGILRIECALREFLAVLLG